MKTTNKLACTLIFLAIAIYSRLPAATSTFSPPAGTYNSQQTVTISSATSPAYPACPTGGRALSESDSGVIVGSTVGTSTFKAIAIGLGQPDSAITTAADAILPPATPTFSPPARP